MRPNQRHNERNMDAVSRWPETSRRDVVLFAHSLKWRGPVKARRTVGEIDAELREGTMIDKPDKHPPMRTEQYAAMLDDALRRPGVREAMAVYDACKQTLDGLDAHRAATATAPRIITTDHANVGP